jgi:glycosyltransferase involved in cell wall biosynthesis
MIDKTEQDIIKNWKGDATKPLVSICTITYNHEMYIAEAIESFLMQETNFAFEIIIGEDSSTDDTANIIRKYAKQYPTIIKAIIREKNIGMIPNFMDTMMQASGKYIALCEGDDFWTDPKKLQMQVDFLELNKNFSGYGHQANVISSQTNNHAASYRTNIPDILDRKYFLRDVPFQTATFVFRTEILKEHPLPRDIVSGDKALMLLISTFGLIKYNSQPMSAYRKHLGGISGRVTMDMMKKDLNIIPWMMKIDPKFPKFQYLSYVYETIMLFPVNLTPIFFLKYFVLYIFYSFSYFLNEQILLYL